MRIYTDLDETLIGNVVDAQGNVTKIIPRPGVDWFLRMLSMHGELNLLTRASAKHARRALRVIGSEARLFKRVITGEDLDPIEEQVQVVLETEGLTEDQRLDLWNRIQPLAKPGVIFDDFPLGSGMWAVKTRAVGSAGDEWIQVNAFFPGEPDQQGLKRAYSEFVARYGDQGPEMGRRRRRRVLSWR